MDLQTALNVLTQFLLKAKPENVGEAASILTALQVVSEAVNRPPELKQVVEDPKKKETG